jgi:hypothetical protein
MEGKVIDIQMFLDLRGRMVGRFEVGNEIAVNLRRILKLGKIVVLKAEY